MDNIIGQPPKWLFWLGTTLFIFIGAIILLLSFWIRYPETATAPFEVISAHHIFHIYSKKKVKVTLSPAIKSIEIKKGDTLMWFSYRDGLKNLILQPYLSPVDGKYDLKTARSLDQEFDSGNLICSIVSQDETQIVFTANAKDAEEISAGQSARLTVLYPNNKIIEINNLSILSRINNTSDSSYKIYACPIIDMQAVDQNSLFLKPGMLGTAEIKIANLRLSERLFKFHF